MSIYEGSFKSLLQGVSQQVPRDRQPGQLSSQINMISDPVTGIRRRPGSQLWKEIETPNSISRDKIATWYGTLGTDRVHIIIDSLGGNMYVIDDDKTLIRTVTNDDYLKADKGKDIRFTVLDDSIYICNVSKPVISSGVVVRNTNGGYATIISGALSTQYTIRVTYSGGNFVGTYTTPDGTTTGDAAKASTSYIANQLKNSIVSAGIPGTVEVSGTTLCFYGLPQDTVDVTAEDGGAGSIRTSSKGTITNSGELPAKLPNGMNNFLMTVGKNISRSYYRWDSDTGSWLETSSKGSVDTYIQGLKELTIDSYSTLDLEGRLAGDDETNPVPFFMSSGRIDGISSYQGRLVILCGNRVALSASRKPMRFFRSTVESIPDDDPIEIGNVSASAANYEYALQYQRDLVLMSKDYQSVVPGGSTPISPRTATVVLASEYNALTDIPPESLGRTFIFPFDKGSGYFGFREVAPSPYTESQFISIESTQHLPRYLDGKPTFLSVDTGNSKVIIGGSVNLKECVLHDYLWNDSEKIKASWSKFNFNFDIINAYFANSQLFFITFIETSNKILMINMDLQRLRTNETAGLYPFLDLYSYITITNNIGTIPSYLLDILNEYDLKDNLFLVVKNGDLSGEPVGFNIDYDTGEITTESSFVNGDVSIGLRYISSIITTPPLVKDQNDLYIATAKQTLLRYNISTNNSSEYYITARDNRTSGYSIDNNYNSALTWSSRQLNLNNQRIAGESKTVVALRLDTESSEVTIHTDNTSEMNILGIDYLMRFNLKHKRM